MTLGIMTSLFQAIGFIATVSIGIWMFKDEIDLTEEEA